MSGPVMGRKGSLRLVAIILYPACTNHVMMMKMKMMMVMVMMMMMMMFMPPIVMTVCRIAPNQLGNRELVVECCC